MLFYILYIDQFHFAACNYFFNPFCNRCFDTLATWIKSFFLTKIMPLFPLPYVKRVGKTPLSRQFVS